MSLRRPPNYALLNELKNWYPVSLAPLNQIDDPSQWAKPSVMNPMFGVKVYITYFSPNTQRFSLGIGILQQNYQWLLYNNESFSPLDVSIKVYAWYVGTEFSVPLAIQNLVVV